MKKLPDFARLNRGGLLDRSRARIYFVAGAGLIKIGVTTDVSTRFRGLCNSSPVPLELLGSYPGTRYDEGDLHEKFAHRRKHGEWFERCAEIENEIERLNLTAQAQTACRALKGRGER